MTDSTDIPKAYDPSEVEDRWYARWEADGCFAGKPVEGQPTYSIVIPPPNVTGVLTIGHVLNNTIQDILSRRARQKGAAGDGLPEEVEKLTSGRGVDVAVDVSGSPKGMQTGIDTLAPRVSR